MKKVIIMLVLISLALCSFSSVFAATDPTKEETKIEGTIVPVDPGVTIGVDKEDPAAAPAAAAKIALKTDDGRLINLTGNTLGMESFVGWRVRVYGYYNWLTNEFYVIKWEVVGFPK